MTNFPLDNDFQINFENKTEIEEEKPLLFNPTKDNPCELFQLKFIPFNTKGVRLKIEALSTNKKDSYKYKKAKKTIEIFNLNGDLKDKNPDDTITRKRNAENLFTDLYDLAIFWRRFKDNPHDKTTEKQFFNKLKILRKIKCIDLEKLVLKDNFEILN